MNQLVCFCQDVLRDFIYCSTTIGWTSRQQFEETWMSLLGVINPVALDERHISAEVSGTSGIYPFICFQIFAATRLRLGWERKD